jgi:hypothetical protein
MIETGPDLERLVHVAMKMGRLPRKRVRDFSGGFGTSLGIRCAGCGNLIGQAEAFAKAALGTRGLILHVTCYEMWQMHVANEAAIKRRRSVATANSTPKAPAI